jgi:hypothetical protein
VVVENLGTLKDMEPGSKAVVVVFPECVEQHCTAVGASFRFRRFSLTTGEKLKRSFDRDCKKEQCLLDLTMAIEEPLSTDDRATGTSIMRSRHMR